MTNKRKTKKQLRNGCSRTEVFISPKNYKTLKNKSDLTKDWFVECRFYDPLFKINIRKVFNLEDGLKNKVH